MEFPFRHFAVRFPAWRRGRIFTLAGPPAGTEGQKTGTLPHETREHEPISRRIARHQRMTRQSGSRQTLTTQSSKRRAAFAGKVRVSESIYSPGDQQDKHAHSYATISVVLAG